MRKHKIIFSAICFLVSSTLMACNFTPSGNNNNQNQTTLSSISITHLPNKTEYFVNEQFDKTGLEVTALYSDNSTKVVSDDTLSNVNMSSVGEKKVTVTYQSKTADFSILVKERQGEIKLASIELLSLPNKIEYIEGEEFDPTGLKVLAVYSDNNRIELGASEYQLSRPNMSQLGKQQVTVTYKEFSVKFEINISKRTTEQVLVRIEVVSLPNKTVYELNERFDSTGLVVRAVYSNGDQVTITDYTLSAVDTSSAGEKVVTVTYQGKTTTFSVTVRAPATLTGIKIYTDEVKKEYFVGEQLDLTGLRVLAVYSDGYEVAITNYTVGEVDMTTTGSKVVTISYSGFSKTFSITVKPTEISDKDIALANLLAMKSATISYVTKTEMVRVQKMNSAQPVNGSGESTQTTPSAININMTVDTSCVVEYDATSLKASDIHADEVETIKLSDALVLYGCSNVDMLKENLRQSMGNNYNVAIDEENDLLTISYGAMNEGYAAYVLYDESNQQQFSFVQGQHKEDCSVTYLRGGEGSAVSSLADLNTSIINIARVAIMDGTYDASTNTFTLTNGEISSDDAEFIFGGGVKINLKELKLSFLGSVLSSLSFKASPIFDGNNDYYSSYDIEATLAFSKVNSTTIVKPTIPTSVLCPHYYEIGYDEIGEGHRKYCTHCNKYLTGVENHRIDENEAMCVDCHHINDGEKYTNEALQLNGEDYANYVKSGNNVYFLGYNYNFNRNNDVVACNRNSFALYYVKSDQRLVIFESVGPTNSSFSCRNIGHYNLTVYKIDYTIDRFAQALEYYSHTDPTTGETVTDYEQMIRDFAYYIDGARNGKMVKDHEYFEGLEVLLSFDFKDIYQSHQHTTGMDTVVGTCEHYGYEVCNDCHEIVGSYNHSFRHDEHYEVLANTEGFEKCYENSVFVKSTCGLCEESHIYEVDLNEDYYNGVHPYRVREHYANGDAKSYADYKYNLPHIYDENHECIFCHCKEIKSIEPVLVNGNTFLYNADGYNWPDISYFKVTLYDDSVVFTGRNDSGSSPYYISLNYDEIQLGENVFEGNCYGFKFSFTLNYVATEAEIPTPEPYFEVLATDVSAPVNTTNSFIVLSNQGRPEVRAGGSAGISEIYSGGSGVYYIYVRDEVVENVDIEVSIPGTSYQKTVHFLSLDETVFNFSTYFNMQEKDVIDLEEIILDNIDTNRNINEFTVEINYIENEYTTYDATTHILTAVNTSENKGEFKVAEVTFTRGEEVFKKDLYLYVNPFALEVYYNYTNYVSDYDINKNGFNLNSIEFGYNVEDPENVNITFAPYYNDDSFFIDENNILRASEGVTLGPWDYFYVRATFTYGDCEPVSELIRIYVNESYFYVPEHFSLVSGENFTFNELFETNIIDLSGVIITIPPQYQEYVIVDENNVFHVLKATGSEIPAIIYCSFSDFEIEERDIRVYTAEPYINVSNGSVTVGDYSYIRVNTNIDASKHPISYEIVEGSEFIEIRDNYDIKGVKAGTARIKAYAEFNGENLYSEIFEFTVNPLQVTSEVTEIGGTEGFYFNINSFAYTNSNSLEIQVGFVSGEDLFYALEEEYGKNKYVEYFYYKEGTAVIYPYIIYNGEVIRGENITVTILGPEFKLYDISMHVGEAVDPNYFSSYSTNKVTPQITYVVVSGEDCLEIVNGKLHALKSGSATVKATFTTNAGKSFVSNTVTITIEEVQFRLLKEEISLVTNSNGYLSELGIYESNVELYFKLASENNNLNYEDQTIIYVYNGGYYEAYSNTGSVVCNIYARLNGVSEYPKLGEFTIKVEEAYLTMSNASIADHTYLDKAQLKELLDVKTNISDKYINFYSDESSVSIMLNGNGSDCYFLAHSAGEARINAYAYGDFIAYAIITVEENSDLVAWSEDFINNLATQAGYINAVKLPYFNNDLAVFTYEVDNEDSNYCFVNFRFVAPSRDEFSLINDFHDQFRNNGWYCYQFNSSYTSDKLGVNTRAYLYDNVAIIFDFVPFNGRYLYVDIKLQLPKTGNLKTFKIVAPSDLEIEHPEELSWYVSFYNGDMEMYSREPLEYEGTNDNGQHVFLLTIDARDIYDIYVCLESYGYSVQLTGSSDASVDYVLQ